MSARFFLMLFAALFFATIAALIANNWIRNKTAGQEHSDHPVVVAATDIPFGIKLEEIHVKIINWPSADVPEGSFRQAEDAIGKIVRNTFYSGEVITQKRVSEHLGGSTLSSLISEKFRAVTVRVDDVVGVAGFVLPGNRVDVLATRRVGTASNQTETRTILEDIKVLAVDQEASPDKEKPAVVRAVTMELTPEQAEKVVDAMKEGTIQLTLRNPLDASKSDKKGPEPKPLVKVRRTYRPPSIIKVEPW
ncbi:MAG: Flp pilus assembly protein CpaB [Methylococcaceae bacterium]|nr:Flp pilus assembly protein CpaB [Methylococcaceae bacterium]